MAALPGTGAASVPQVRELLAGLCVALERVHAAGVAHRDLKPENLFLREGGTLSLLDFGLARLLDGAEEPEEGEGAVALTRTGQRLGTPHYMSPEQCLDAREAGGPADVYALGILLFELLTGAPPFCGSSEEVRHGHVSLRPPSVSERAAVPPALDEVLRRCLAKAPAERFAHVREVLEAFEEACRTTQAVPRELPAALPATEAGRAGHRLVALLGVESDAPVEALLAAVEPQGGVLARVCERGYGVVFPESPSAEASLRAAAFAARRLVEESGAAGVLHLAELAVHPGTLTPRVAGAALVEPRAWWPPETQRGEVRVTAEAAARLGAGSTRSGPEGTVWLVREQSAAALPAEVPPLVGREALLEALYQESSRALREGVPGMCVLTGEVGHGKTRLLEALAERWEREGRARVVHVRAPSPEALVPGAPLRALEAPPRWGRCAEELRQRARDVPQVVLVDDAHAAEALSLDALERATLSGARAPLWVCVAGRPVLLGQRPHLGERSALSTRHVLAPLPPEASRALLLHLLRPVEFIPEPVLARLEHLAQGVPLSLVELTGTLRSVGALRASSGGGWYIAPDALLDVSVTPLFERLALRALSELPEVHQVLARLCAVLGDEVTVSRVDAALRQLEAREAVARVASWDAGAGLARLARAGAAPSGGSGALRVPPPAAPRGPGGLDTSVHPPGTACRGPALPDGPGCLRAPPARAPRRGLWGPRGGGEHLPLARRAGPDRAPPGGSGAALHAGPGAARGGRRGAQGPGAGGPGTGAAPAPALPREPGGSGLRASPGPGPAGRGPGGGPPAGGGDRARLDGGRGGLGGAHPRGAGAHRVPGRSPPLAAAHPRAGPAARAPGRVGGRGAPVGLGRRRRGAGPGARDAGGGTVAAGLGADVPGQGGGGAGPLRRVPRPLRGDGGRAAPVRHAHQPRAAVAAAGRRGAGGRTCGEPSPWGASWAMRRRSAAPPSTSRRCSTCRAAWRRRCPWHAARTSWGCASSGSSQCRWTRC